MPSVKWWRPGYKRPVGLAALAVVAVGLGFAQHGIAVLALGAGAETDALFAGYALPQIVLVVLGTTLANVLVPLLAGEREEEVHRSAWAFFLFITVTFSVLALLLGATARLWTPLLFPGFDDMGNTLAVDLTRIQLVGMVFSAQAVVLSSVYQSQKRFRWPATTPVIGGVIGLVVLLATLEPLGIHAAAWASNVRLGVQAFFLLPVLGAFAWPAKGAPLVREAWQRACPLVVAGAYYRSDILVDRWLASLTPAGGLSLLFLATRLYGVASQVVNSAVTLPEMQRLATVAKAGSWQSFGASYRRLVAVVLGMTLALYFVTISGLPLVGGFSSGSSGEDLQTLWLLLVALGGVLVAGGTGQVLSSAHYARGDTRTPTRIGVIGFTMGIGLKALGLSTLGLVGVALGTSLYYIFIAVGMHHSMTKTLSRAY